MVQLVDMLLSDLGLYSCTPSTFPELIVWIIKFVVGAALIAGTVKTFLIVCQRFSDGGTRW